ncbi:MAG: hypothetical protein ACXWEY_11645 [Bacteroidia bacterium]
MRILIFCFLVLIGFSCASNAEKSKENADKNSTQTEETSSSEKPEKYAETTITINGKKQKFRFKEINKDKVEAIKKIAESGKKLEFYEKKLIDITGEGSLDTIEIKIDRLGENEFRLTNSIFTHGKFVLRDTLMFTENNGEYYYEEEWHKDSTYYKLKTYSDYISVFDHINFIDNDFNYNEWVEEDWRKNMFEHAVKRFLESKGLLNKYKDHEGKYGTIPKSV